MLKKKIIITLITILIISINSFALLSAGTKIENKATGEFKDLEGNKKQVESNTVITQIIPVEDFRIIPNGSIEEPGQEKQALAGEEIAFNYVAENLGNTDITVNLSVEELFNSENPLNLLFFEIYYDENGNGIIDPGEEIVNSMELIEGESKNLIVKTKVPEEATPGDEFFLNIIGVNPNDGATDDDNVSKIFILSDVPFKINKEVDKKSIYGGEELTFTITINNYSLSRTNKLELIEYIDYNEMNEDGVFVKNSIETNHGYMTKWFDGNEWVFEEPDLAEDIKGFSLSFIESEFGDVIVAEFSLFFPDNVTLGTRINKAYLKYETESGLTGEIETDPVDYRIKGLGVPLIGPFEKPEVEEMGPEDITIISSGVVQGYDAVFKNTVKNSGNMSMTIDIELQSVNYSNENWTYEFTYLDGTPLTDTNNNSTIDLGVFQPGEEKSLYFIVNIPKDVYGNNSGSGWWHILEVSGDNSLTTNKTIDLIENITRSDFLQISKESLSPDLISIGKSIDYQITATNTADFPLTNVEVIDILSDHLGEPFNIQANKEFTYTYNNQNKEFKVFVDRLEKFDVFEFTFSATTSSEATEGTVVENSATIKGNFPTGEIEVESNEVENILVYAEIEIAKYVEQEEIELGDQLDYIVQIFNPSSIATITMLEMADIIPEGTEYIQDSAQVEDEPFEPEYENGILHFVDLPDIEPSGMITVEYSLNFIEYFGDTLVNTASASGMMITSSSEAGATAVTSNQAEVETEVKAYDFDKTTGIFGRVYIDENDNEKFDSEDTVVPDIGIFLEDGHFSLSDNEGLFNFSNLKPGSHVLKIDIDQSMYKLDRIQDERDLGNPRSFVFSLEPTFYTAIEIRLKRIIEEEEEIFKLDFNNVSGIDSRSIMITQVNSTSDFDTLGKSQYSEFVYPEDGEIFVGQDMINVQIGIPMESTYELLLNGVRVDESKIGVISENLEGTEKFVEYYSLSLNEYWNELQVKWFDSQGFKGESKIDVYLSGKPAGIKSEIDPLILKADGISSPLINILIVDKNGYRASAGGDLQLTGLDPKLIKDYNLTVDNVSISLENGLASFSLIPSVVPKIIKFNAQYSDFEENIRVEYQTDQRAALLSGIIEAGFSVKDQKFYFDGRAFGKLALGDGLLTFRYGENQIDENPNSYFDFGDSSVINNLTPSSEDYYVRYDLKTFNIMLGNYTFDNNKNKIINLSNSGFGLSSEYFNDDTGLSIFVKPGDMKKVEEEIRGKGIRGIYWLKNQEIVKNSQQVYIVTKNEDSEEINSRFVEKGKDYEINYTEGYLIFNYPVPQFDENFNPVFIQINYELQEKIDTDFQIFGDLDYKFEDGSFNVSMFIDGVKENKYNAFSASLNYSLNDETDLSLGGAVSMKDGEIGGKIKSTVNIDGDFGSGKFDVTYTKNFVNPFESSYKSKLYINASFAPKNTKIKIQGNYEYDFDEEYHNLNAEVGSYTKLKNGFLEYTFGYLLWNREEDTDSEFRLTARPSINLENMSISGEAFVGLKNFKPTFGIDSVLEVKLENDYSVGADIILNYNNQETGALYGSLESFVKKNLGTVSLYLKNKTQFLPELETSFIVGLSHNNGEEKASVNLGIGSDNYIEGSYGNVYDLGPVIADLLIEGKYSLNSSSTENFNSIHFGLQNDYIENLNAGISFDARLNGLKLDTLFVESYAYYNGYESVYPALKIRYSKDNELLRDTFDVNAALAWRPRDNSNFYLLLQGNYNYLREDEDKKFETSIMSDFVTLFNNGFELDLSMDAYMKPEAQYIVGGIALRKWFFERFAVRNAFNVILDNNMNFYYRNQIEGAVKLFQNTEAYVGYGFGPLQEDFIGKLHKNGLYFGVRFVIDDNWLFGNVDKKESSIVLRFFEDLNNNELKDTDERDIQAKVLIDELIYEADEKGIIELDIVPGTYEIELIDFPPMYSSLFGEKIKINIEKNQTREFNWTFVKKPGYVVTRVFEDVNSNGIKDPEERYFDNFNILAGEYVLLTEDSSITIPIEPGEVNISLDISAFGEDVILTTKEINKTVKVLPAQRVDVEFGIYISSKLTVKVFDDINGDGIKQENEQYTDKMITLDIAGKPYSVIREKLITFVPEGKNKLNVLLDPKISKRYVLTGVPEYINLNGAENLLEIGIAEKPSLLINFFMDENNDGLKNENEEIINDLFEIKLDQINLQLIGFIELNGLQSREYIIEIIKIPEELNLETKIYPVELLPAEDRIINIPIYN